MEDVRWLLRRFGLPILLLLIFVIVGVICWGKYMKKNKKGGRRSMGATYRNGKAVKQ